MSKRSRGSHHSRRQQFTIPLAVVAGFASPVGRTIGEFQSGGPKGAVKELSRIMIGIDPFASPVTWQPYLMSYGALPVAIGLMVHKAANMLGLNRMLARSGIPLIRI